MTDITEKVTDEEIKPIDVEVTSEVTKRNTIDFFLDAETVPVVEGVQPPSVGVCKSDDSGLFLHVLCDETVADEIIEKLTTKELGYKINSKEDFDNLPANMKQVKDGTAIHVFGSTIRNTSEEETIKEI